MQLTLAFSPCPNDTFIFDALANGLIDTRGLSFSISLKDVEELNRDVLQGLPDISKISFGAWPEVSENYTLLDKGAALGRGVGPLLISADPLLKVLPDDMKVALPGEHTTAHMLFTHAYPGHTRKIFLRYDQIESFVMKGHGAGVIIHEGRFTYRKKGLFLIRDLGSYWEKYTGSAIPLGGIVIRSAIPDNLKSLVNDLIRESIEFAWKRYPEVSGFIRNNALEMSEDVMRKHIELYVNDFSLSLGEEGVRAVHKLEDVFSKLIK
jgi:1,4-dihydroxy-6-naphthoate synthase